MALDGIRVERGHTSDIGCFCFVIRDEVENGEGVDEIQMYTDGSRLEEGQSEAALEIARLEE